MTRRLLSFFLLLVSSSCFCGEIEEALSRAGLVESKIPTGDAWSSANRNLVDYVIAYDAGHLTIKEVRDLRRPENRKIAFHDTLLISVNKGEWRRLMRMGGGSDENTQSVGLRAKKVSNRRLTSRNNEKSSPYEMHEED